VERYISAIITVLVTLVSNGITIVIMLNYYKVKYERQDEKLTNIEALTKDIKEKYLEEVWLRLRKAELSTETQRIQLESCQKLCALKMDNLREHRRNDDKDSIAAY
jgi:hypothetical protein